MKPDSSTTRSRRLSLWLASLAVAGLLPVGATSLSAQTTDPWNGGTGNWSDNTFWSTGSVPNDAAADVYVDGDNEGVDSVVNVNGDYTVGRLTVDYGDTVSVANGANLTIRSGAFDGSGSVVNNGTINIIVCSNACQAKDRQRCRPAAKVFGTLWPDLAVQLSIAFAVMYSAGCR